MSPRTPYQVKRGGGDGAGLFGPARNAATQTVSGCNIAWKRPDSAAIEQTKCLPILSIGDRIVRKDDDGLPPEAVQTIAVGWTWT